MNEDEAFKTLRRKLILSAPFAFLGATTLHAMNSFAQDVPRGPDLSEKLSPAELEMTGKSAMAVDLDNYWHKGYSCAESELMVALRFMKKPEDLVWVAAGFGGGMGHQDLCGFLTAGIMAIGIYAGSEKIEAKEAKMRCSRKTSEYWTWWASTAPLHCREIREGRNDFNVCHRLGKLAAVKLESLLKI